MFSSSPIPGRDGVLSNPDDCLVLAPDAVVVASFLRSFDDDAEAEWQSK